MRSLSLPLLLAAAALAGCGGSDPAGDTPEAEAPPASDIYQGPEVDLYTGPCRAGADPHSPETVAAAFGDAGFDVTVNCDAGETRILAVPAGEGEVTFCSVAGDATAMEKYPNGVVRGNVACWGPSSAAQRAALRTLLDGL